MKRCGCQLSLGDDFGDNSCTFKCQLEYQHEGQHEEKFEDVVIHWSRDDRDECLCGHLQCYHAHYDLEGNMIDEKCAFVTCGCQKFEKYTGPYREKIP